SDDSRWQARRHSAHHPEVNECAHSGGDDRKIIGLMLTGNRLKVHVVTCILGALALSVSCTQDTAPATVQPRRPYFSVETYFKAEADRLQKSAPLVTKTVNKNGEQETHAVRIS